MQSTTSKSSEPTIGVFVVPTKFHSNNSSALAKRAGAGDKPDAFAKYSDDARRMKTLLMIEDADVHSTAALHLPSRSNDSGAPKRRKANSSRPIQDGEKKRKTRLSFEVHPSLLFDDLDDMLWSEGAALASVSDDEDEAEGTTFRRLK